MTTHLTQARTARMRQLHAADGTYLSHTDWGHGRPIVMLAGWAMPSMMWDYQRVPLTERGYRCIAFDRRGHGRSDHPGHGYDVDTLADDLAAVLDQLELEGVMLVGHSIGACEIMRYLTRHRRRRVSRVALVAPATPGIPAGSPAIKEASERMRAELRVSYPHWIRQNARPFVLEHTPEAMISWGESLMHQTPLKVALDTHAAMLETDLAAEMAAIDVPTLILHGDRDASAPLVLTGERTANLLKRSRLRVYEGAPHGLMWTHAAQVTDDLDAWFQQDVGTDCA